MPRVNKHLRAIADAEYRTRPGVSERRKLNFTKWANENPERIKERAAKRRLQKRAQCLVATVRTRAKKRGLEFDLDEHVAQLQTRIDSGKCELTGWPFDLSPGRKFNSPSIDRIDPKGGYTYENVRLVLNMVNVALGDWGEEPLRDVMRSWLRTPRSLAA